MDVSYLNYSLKYQTNVYWWEKIRWNNPSKASRENFGRTGKDLVEHVRKVWNTNLHGRTGSIIYFNLMKGVKLQLLWKIFVGTWIRKELGSLRKMWKKGRMKKNPSRKSTRSARNQRLEHDVESRNRWAYHRSKIPPLLTWTKTETDWESVLIVKLKLWN